MICARSIRRSATGCSLGSGTPASAMALASGTFAAVLAAIALATARARSDARLTIQSLVNCGRSAAYGAGAAGMIRPTANTTKPLLFGKVSTVASSSGLASNPVFRTAARLAGNVYPGFDRATPVAVIGGVSIIANLLAAATSAKLLPSAMASSTRVTRSVRASIRFSGVSLATISGRAAASDLPASRVADSILMTCQPRSDWIGPTRLPGLAANVAAATLAPARALNCSRLCGPTETSAALRPAGALAATKLAPDRIRATIASAAERSATTAWLSTRTSLPP